jgi:hypothetical protein
MAIIVLTSQQQEIPTAIDKKLRLPWDVVDRIVLFAWLNHSVRVHLALYSSLARICTHLRDRVRALAQRYMFYRCPQDRSLCSRLGILPGRPIAEFHVELPSHNTKWDEWLTAELSWLQPALYHSEFATEQNIAFMASTMYLYQAHRSGPYAGSDMKSQDTMDSLLSAWEPLRPHCVVLVNIFPHSFHKESSAHLHASSICRLTLDITRGDVYGWMNWSRSNFSLCRVFPHLTHLSILSSCQSLTYLLPLPVKMEELALDILVNIPSAPRGNLHSWGLIFALEQQLQLSDEAKAQFRLVLLTGWEDPVEWPKVSLMAREMGIRLERRIVH